MTSITQNNVRYLPHELKTRLHAVETYRNGNSIEYVCRKYHISRTSSLCFTFWGLCDIIYMSRMNLERNIFDWLVNLNSFSTNEIVASQSKIFFLGFK